MKEIEIFKKPFFWLALTLVLIIGVIFSLPDKQLHLIFCDVGQGDAILISYSQTQILIDGGPNNQVSNCLSKYMPFWDRQIEMIILTHQDGDHLNGLIDVLERYSVNYFVSNGLSPSDSIAFNELETIRKKKKVQLVSVKTRDRMKIGPLYFLFLWPEKNYLNPDNLNESSVVFRLSYGNFTALLTGDISERIENLLDLPAGRTEVLKVAHHGSRFSTSEGFLSKIKPKLAIISVGKNNFGHPAQSVLERLKKIGTKVLRTDQQGDIEIVSNGQGWYTRIYDQRAN